MFCEDAMPTKSAQDAQESMPHNYAIDTYKPAVNSFAILDKEISKKVIRRQ